MPTTSLGLTYPASSEHVRIWEHIQNLAQSVDTLLAPTLGAWTAYTPTFSASTSGGAIGNGTIAGRYRRSGKTVIYHAKMTWGSTTTPGTGFFRMGLPSTRNVSADITGSGVIIDASSAGVSGYQPVTTLGGTPETNYVFVVISGGFAGSTTPFTWTTGDIIRWSGTYEEV